MSEPREGRPGSSSTFTVRSAPQRRRLDALARESRWWLRSATRPSRVRQREVSEIETGRTRIVDVGCVLAEVRAGSQEQQTTWSAGHVSRKQLQDSRTGLFLPPAMEVVGELILLEFSSEFGVTSFFEDIRAGTEQVFGSSGRDTILEPERYGNGGRRE